MPDYETDPRPLAVCLREWQAAINGGTSYRARPKAAALLRAEETTYIGWLAGRTPSSSHERLIRHVMSQVDCPHLSDKAR